MFSMSWFYIGLVLTILVECTLLTLLNGRKWVLAFKIAVINAITYTILSGVLITASRNLREPGRYVWFVFMGEIAVVLVEALYFKIVLKWTKKRSLLMSLSANGTSVLAGLILGLILN
jgi:hypothetical protein